MEHGVFRCSHLQPRSSHRSAQSSKEPSQRRGKQRFGIDQRANRSIPGISHRDRQFPSWKSSYKKLSLQQNCFLSKLLQPRLNQR